MSIVANAAVPQSAWSTLKEAIRGTYCLGAIGLVFRLFAPTIVSAFTREPGLFLVLGNPAGLDLVTPARPWAKWRIRRRCCRVLDDGCRQRVAVFEGRVEGNDGLRFLVPV